MRSTSLRFAATEPSSANTHGASGPSCASGGWVRSRSPDRRSVLSRGKLWCWSSATTRGLSRGENARSWTEPRLVRAALAVEQQFQLDKLGAAPAGRAVAEDGQRVEASLAAQRLVGRFHTAQLGRGVEERSAKRRPVVEAAEQQRVGGERQRQALLARAAAEEQRMEHILTAHDERLCARRRPAEFRRPPRRQHRLRAWAVRHSPVVARRRWLPWSPQQHSAPLHPPRTGAAPRQQRRRCRRRRHRRQHRRQH